MGTYDIECPLDHETGPKGPVQGGHYRDAELDLSILIALYSDLLEIKSFELV